MKKNPLLSIIIPTRNNEDRLDFLLKLLNNQSYKNLEIIISDAFSTDGTRKIAIKYKTILIDNPKLMAEPGVSAGMNKASGDLIMILAVDNYFYNSYDLEKIVSVFEDNNIYAAFPKHESKNNYSLYSKYINSFTDPFNHFIYGYAANARTFHRIYLTKENNKLYDIYDYSSNSTKPMLAFAQGFTVRKGFSRTKDDELDDITPIIKLIEERKDIAYVKGVCLFHDTIRDMNHFIRKMEWAAANALEKKNYGITKRQNMLTSFQLRKILFLLYAFSVLAPIIVSLYFSIKDRQIIWLFHPFITLLTAGAITKQLLFRALGFTGAVSRI
ncbi:glycosyltransferase family 2 protein [Candidatus Woesebacteria bacterium]|nr:glycosyltransferase family 2 protein [Candidatus Woesebacteria bacterium]